MAEKLNDVTVDEAKVASAQKKVDEKADAITCSDCVQRQLAGPLWISEEEYFENLIYKESQNSAEEEE
jgi:hypothetical protein